MTHWTDKRHPCWQVQEYTEEELAARERALRDLERADTIPCPPPVEAGAPEGSEW